MKITIISDTHGHHERLGRLGGEVLIHCGDMFNLFSPNYDFPLEANLARRDSQFGNAIYLEGGSHIHEGFHFFGAPWIPELAGQASFRKPQDLQRKWAGIPKGVDVLITHSPPAGVLDISRRKLQLGCDLLAARLADLAPRLHRFGHVHTSSGTLQTGPTVYVNAALVNSQYELTRRRSASGGMAATGNAFAWDGQRQPF